MAASAGRGHNRLESTISSLIAVAESGDRTATDALFVTLYAELHRLARGHLARNAGELTLGTTTLLHEAYLDMAARDGAAFPDRGRFMAYAARAMRGLIIDYARNRRAQKRGGQFEIASLETDVVDASTDDKELTRISEALDELATVDPTLVRVVDLKFFCGFSFAEIGAMWGQSERTVQRHWEKARIYLHRALGESL
jgi:RNA polymerase sigma factor (TIGR02999 family)